MPVSTIEPFSYLKISQNPNGSLTRANLTGVPEITTDDYFISPILIKDVPLDETKNTWFRIYVPRFAPVGKKLPLVVYFHGGGFILFSPKSDLTHQLCSNMARALPAVVVSLDYRLAPEHRLPAAYEDAVDIVHMLKNCKDELLVNYADLSNCFLMGSSSGGNIAYHVGLRLVKASLTSDLEPLKIKGLVLHHAFFGGVERTATELRLINIPVLPLSVTDLMWELSLPEGADRDHEYSNLRNGDTYEEEIEKLKEIGCKVLVVGGKEDTLVDRQIEVAEILEKRGVDVESVFGEGDIHMVEWFDESKGRLLFERLRTFVSKSKSEEIDGA